MKVAVVGVTGLVGTRMVEVLEERNFPVDEFIPVASGRSAGKLISFKGKEYPVVTAEEAVAMKPDLALFSAGADISKEWAPKFAAVGCRVVDNSSCWRMDPTKKLVVPEINADVLTEDDYIIANPNCSTIQMLLPLAPLHEKYTIKRIVVSTYQSVTGSGTPAINQMMTERNGGKWGEYPAFYHYPIDQNVIPHIDDFLDNGYTKEEMKMVNEFEKDFTLEDVKEIWSKTEGVTIQDDPDNFVYPMPLYSLGKDDVFVGRLRRDPSVKYGLNFWCVSDNIRKGAATNAVQIAEVLLQNHWI